MIARHGQHDAYPHATQRFRFHVIIELLYLLHWPQKKVLVRVETKENKCLRASVNVKSTDLEYRLITMLYSKYMHCG